MVKKKNVPFSRPDNKFFEDLNSISAVKSVRRKGDKLVVTSRLGVGDKMASAMIEDYKKALEPLVMNSKPMINMLTMMAEDNIAHAPLIVQTIEQHLLRVPPNVKLPVLYLIDSIIKNVAKGPYPELFTQNIVSTFCGVFETVDEKVKQQMHRLRLTWTDVISARKLYSIDVRCHTHDRKWPIAPLPPTNASSIHVNPRFLNNIKSAAAPRQPAATLKMNSVSEIKPAPLPQAGDPDLMRAKLLQKQKELLELQQKKIELELRQMETNVSEVAVKTKLQQDILATEKTMEKQKLLLDQAERAKNQTHMASKILSNLTSTQSSTPASIVTIPIKSEKSSSRSPRRASENEKDKPRSGTDEEKSARKKSENDSGTSSSSPSRSPRKKEHEKEKNNSHSRVPSEKEKKHSRKTSSDTSSSRRSRKGHDKDDKPRHEKTSRKKSDDGDTFPKNKRRSRPTSQSKSLSLSPTSKANDIDSRRQAVLKRNYRKAGVEIGEDIKPEVSQNIGFQDLDLRKELEGEPQMKRTRAGSENTAIVDVVDLFGFGREDVDLRQASRAPGESKPHIKKGKPADYRGQNQPQNPWSGQTSDVWLPGFQPDSTGPSQLMEVERAVQRFDPQPAGGAWGPGIGPHPRMNVNVPQFPDQWSGPPQLPRPTGPNPFEEALRPQGQGPLLPPLMRGRGGFNPGMRRGRGHMMRRGGPRFPEMRMQGPFPHSHPHQQGMQFQRPPGNMPRHGEEYQQGPSEENFHEPEREFQHRIEPRANGESVPDTTDIAKLLSLAAEFGFITQPESEATLENDAATEVNDGNVVSTVVPMEQRKKNKDLAPVAPPVDIDLVSNKKSYFTERRDGLIDTLWIGQQCSSCGLRFPQDQVVRYSQHLDWHFRRNRREKVHSKKAQSRSWYYQHSDWIQFSEVEDSDERAASMWDVQDDADEAYSPTGDMNTDECTVLQTGNEGATCPVCGEAFVSYYDNDSEEWRFKNAILDDADSEEKLYHVICYQDYLKSLEEEPMQTDIPNTVTIDQHSLGAPSTSEETLVESTQPVQTPAVTPPPAETPDDDDEVLILKEGKKDVVLMEIVVDDEEGLNEVKSDEATDKNKNENGPDLSQGNSTENNDTSIAEKPVPAYSIFARSVESPIVVNDDSSSNLLPGISEDSSGGVFGFALNSDRIRPETPEPVEEKKILYKSMVFDFPKIKIEPPDDALPEEEVSESIDTNTDVDMDKSVEQVHVNTDPIDLTADESMDAVEESVSSPRPLHHTISIDGNTNHEGTVPVPFVPPTKIRINITGLDFGSKSPKSPKPQEATSAAPDKSPVPDPQDDRNSPKEPESLSPSASDSNDSSSSEIVFSEDIKRLKPRLVGRKLVNCPPKQGKGELSGLCVIS